MTSHGSFLQGEVLSRFNKSALLLIRKWTRHKRPLMRKHLAELADAQVERKLLMRQACVEEKIEKYREAYARAMVEWNVEVSYLYVGGCIDGRRGGGGAGGGEVGGGGGGGEENVCIERDVQSFQRRYSERTSVLNVCKAFRTSLKLSTQGFLGARQ